jgi:beta-lactamase class A
MTLTNDLRSLLEGRTGTFGVYARNLDTNEIGGVGADRVMDTASAAKTFALVHYSRLVESGARDPARRVTIGAEDQVMGSGVLRYLEPGVQLTLNDLAWLMIIVSDNAATDLLVREVGGPDAVNETMAALGMPTARLNPSFTRHLELAEWQPFGTSTPRDLATVYAHLDERCRAILSRQQFVEGLPRRLPHANQAADWGITMPVRVFNKTGGDPGVFTDAALFETDKGSWIVAFMASDLYDLTGPSGLGPRTAGDVGLLLYDAWGK